MPFCHWCPWPLTLTFNRPSEGPNTSSVWIWRKSVQRFPRYFTHIQKTTDWRRQKQNLPHFTACGYDSNHCLSEPKYQRCTDVRSRTWRIRDYDLYIWCSLIRVIWCFIKTYHITISPCLSVGIRTVPVQYEYIDRKQDRASAVCHLGCKDMKFLIVCKLKMVKMHHCTKFHSDSCTRPVHGLYTVVYTYTVMCTRPYRGLHVYTARTRRTDSILRHFWLREVCLSISGSTALWWAYL